MTTYTMGDGTEVKAEAVEGKVAVVELTEGGLPFGAERVAWPEGIDGEGFGKAGWYCVDPDSLTADDQRIILYREGSEAKIGTYVTARLLPDAHEQAVLDELESRGLRGRLLGFSDLVGISFPRGTARIDVMAIVEKTRDLVAWVEPAWLMVLSYRQE